MSGSVIKTPDQALEGTSGGGTAVSGSSFSGTGIFGKSTTGRGLWGQSEFIATVGDSNTGTGVWGHSLKGTGVYGEGFPAGFFKGDVVVTGDITVGGGDCAEEFDLSMIDEVEPGTVMVIGEEGALRESDKRYDKKVAGVVSGAGDLRPGLILDKRPSSDRVRIPIGLVGRVFCKVDASYSPIEVGDLLTTSDTRGHAMKASDPLKSFGTIIGKALRAVREGQTLIPILITLQ